jgi:methionyl-tRNA formyltransferase
MAVLPLRALVAAGHPVELVVTRADKRRGRGGAPQPSPVKAAATELGIPVSHRVDEALETDADLGVVVAYGALVREHVLERLPMVNLHFSLLPRWRGAAPVERALLAGDRETGVCLMQMEVGLDTGPVFGCQAVPIGERTTAAELRDTLVGVGTDLLLAHLAAGLRDPVPQDGPSVYATKIDPDELRLRWDDSADHLDRVVRLGGAWTTFRGRRIKILAATPEPADAHAPDDPPPVPGSIDGLDVRCGAGRLRLAVVQPEGKAPMAAEAWRNGARPTPADRFGA